MRTLHSMPPALTPRQSARARRRRAVGRARVVERARLAMDRAHVDAMTMDARHDARMFAGLRAWLARRVFAPVRRAWARQ